MSSPRVIVIGYANPGTAQTLAALLTAQLGEARASPDGVRSRDPLKAPDSVN
jgi:hypothetical protein